MITYHKKIIRILIWLVLGLAVTISLASLILANRDASVYPSRLYAGTVHLGNLNREQALHKLEEAGERFKLVCTIDQESFSLNLINLGVQVDAVQTIENIDALIDDWTLWEHSLKRGSLTVAPVFRYNAQRIQQSFEKLALSRKRSPVDAQLLLSGDQLTFKPEQEGYQIDVSQAVAAVIQALQEGRTEISLPREALVPRITLEQIKDTADLLALQAVKGDAGNSRQGYSSAPEPGIIILPGRSAHININAMDSLRDNHSLRQWEGALTAAASEAGLQYLPANQAIHNQSQAAVALFITHEDSLWLIRIFGRQTQPGHQISISREYAALLSQSPPSNDKEPLSPQHDAQVPGKQVRVYRHDFIDQVLVKTTLLGEYGTDTGKKSGGALK